MHLVNGQDVCVFNKDSCSEEAAAMQLLATSRATYLEARDIYYGENTFIFCVAHWCDLEEGLTNWLTSLSAMEQMPKVKPIVIIVEKLPPWNDDALGLSFDPSECTICDGLLYLSFDLETLTTDVPNYETFCCSAEEPIFDLLADLGKVLASHWYGFKSGMATHVRFGRRLSKTFRGHGVNAWCRHGGRAEGDS